MARETEKGSGLDCDKRRAREARGLAAERDRQVRVRSVANDTRLNLPVSIPMPDGEEFPGAHLQLRSYDQRAEIQKGYIQGPPNKTICDSSEWIDWETSNVRSSTRDGKTSSSKGQLWGLKLSSGKSPPCHSRPTRDHQRHSNSSSKQAPSSGKHKNSSNSSSSSSTCSSTSSSTSSFTGLGGGLLPTPKTCPTPTPPSSFSEKLQTVFSPSGGSESCRNSPNPNNNSSSGVFSRLIDETKRATRSNSAKSGKKQQIQQAGVSNPNPNGAGTTKVMSVTTTTSSSTTMMTRSSTTITKCDVQQHPQQQHIPSKKSAGFFHQTFSERVEEGSVGQFRDTPSSKSMMTMGSDSDNNGNGNNGRPCLMGGACGPPSAPSPFTPKTDDSQSKQWNDSTLFVRCGGQRSNNVVEDRFSSQSQTSVQNVSDLMIPRTTLLSSDSDVSSDNPQLQPPLLPTPAAPQNFGAARAPQEDQYSSSSSDVELVDQRH